MSLKIEYVPIDSVKMYKRNAKLHPEEQIRQIKKSIEDYGMRDPIGVWHDEIVEGHGRWLACKELGFDTIPIIRLDDMTDEQRREYMLVHNKTNMNSGFDFAKLDEELADLANFESEEFGFAIDKYRELMSGDTSEEPPEEFASFDDDVETAHKCPRCGYEWN